MTVLLPSLILGFSTPLLSYGAAVNQPLQVWFDSPQFLSYDPCAYLLVVNAKTSTGLSITNLHWDFGDGSILDVPYSAQSYVTDTRTHIYQYTGTYNVTVTAYDNTGNSGTSSVTLSNVTPGSCNPAPGTDNSPTIQTPLSKSSRQAYLIPPKELALGIFKFTRKQMAPYKRQRIIQLVNELPKTTS